jgi:hypothetical protein
MNTGNDLSSGQHLPDSITPGLPPGFVERRNPDNQRQSTGFERRQFSNSMSNYSEEAGELGRAIDQYKLMHRRRYVNFEELLAIVKSLGYEKTS